MNPNQAKTKAKAKAKAEQLKKRPSLDEKSLERVVGGDDPAPGLPTGKRM